jgi:hypothetical protein
MRPPLFYKLHRESSIVPANSRSLSNKRILNFPRVTSVTTRKIVAEVSNYISKLFIERFLPTNNNVTSALAVKIAPSTVSTGVLEICVVNLELVF